MAVAIEAVVDHAIPVIQAIVNRLHNAVNAVAAVAAPPAIAHVVVVAHEGLGVIRHQGKIDHNSSQQNWRNKVVTKR